VLITKNLGRHHRNYKEMRRPHRASRCCRTKDLRGRAITAHQPNSDWRLNRAAAMLPSIRRDEHKRLTLNSDDTNDVHKL
jgi:hypothetical protein